MFLFFFLSLILGLSLASGALGLGKTSWAASPKTAYVSATSLGLGLHSHTTMPGLLHGYSELNSGLMIA